MGKYLSRYLGKGVGKIEPGKRSPRLARCSRKSSFQKFDRGNGFEKGFSLSILGADLSTEVSIDKANYNFPYGSI